MKVTLEEALNLIETEKRFTEPYTIFFNPYVSPIVRKKLKRLQLRFKKLRIELKHKAR
jgi:hypothetical protein